MKAEPCECCKDGKEGAIGGGNGFGYNRLGGSERDWAEANQMPRSEYCVRVKGGRKFGGPEWVKKVCGDGTMGFSTRRRNQQEVRLTTGMHGQLMRDRSTLVNKRSSRSTTNRKARRIDGSKHTLLSSEQIRTSQLDLEKINRKVRENRKVQRKAHYATIGRNKLRRATKRARVAA